jgi:hypothetical protein
MHQPSTMPSSSAQRALDRRVKVVLDFESNISPDRIPIVGVTDEAAQRAIKCAIASMTLITINIKQDNTYIQDFISNFHDTWKDVWTWLEFLHTQCVVRREYGESLMLQSLRIIPFIITTFAHEHVGYLRNDIRTTPGIFQILVPHYLQEGDDNTQDLANIESRFNFSSAMRSLLQDVDRRDVAVMANIVEAANGDVDVIAQVTIDRLRSVIAKTPQDLAAILSHLILFPIFVTSAHLPLRSAMLRHELLPIVIERLNVIATQPTHSFIHVIFPLLVTLSFHVLLAMMESANGPSWIAQAVDAGLLLAILELGL